jgi:hypothetical protein
MMSSCQLTGICPWQDGVISLYRRFLGSVFRAGESVALTE